MATESLAKLLLSARARVRSAPAFEALAEPELVSILERTRRFAELRGHADVTAEHYVLALAVDAGGARMLEACGADVETTRAQLAQFLQRPSIPLDWGTLFEIIRTLAHVRAHEQGRRITSARLAAELVAFPCHVRELLASQGVTKLAVVEYAAHGRVHREDAMPLPPARVVAAPEAGDARPGRYEVVFHDDDWTSLAFVLELLEEVFERSGDDAGALVKQIQASGSAAAATYDFKTALAKVERATRLARKNEFPLLLSIRPAP